MEPPEELRSMTLEEKAGQLIMTGFHGEELNAETAALIRDCRVGGLILFGPNVRDPAQLARLCADLQGMARQVSPGVGLFLSIDQEGGAVVRLTERKGFVAFPGSMPLGAAALGAAALGVAAPGVPATGAAAGLGAAATKTEMAALAASGNGGPGPGDGERLTYDAYLATGRQLRALGLNFNLAPVLDVNNNPLNPVIGVRSFGEDPHLVARLGQAAVRGLRDAGVGSCGKHFPGHGDTAVDSHVDLPIIPWDRERLERVELVPFRAAVAAGVDSVMTAHITFRALDPRPGVPATLSAAVLRGLLRGGLGFGGVIVTDAIEMKAVSDRWGAPEAAVLALQAGADVVLVGRRPDIARRVYVAVLKAARDGCLDPAEFDASVGRVLALKARLGLVGAAPSATASARPAPGQPIVPVAGPSPDSVPDTSYLRGVALAAARASVTLVRDRAGLLPLGLGRGERLVVVAPEGHGGLAAYLRLHHGVVTELRYPAEVTPADIERAGLVASAARAVVVATAEPRINEALAALVRAVVTAGRPGVWAGLSSPYDLAAVPTAPTYVATYSYRDASLQALAEALFGQIPFRGRLPVTVPE